jgi:uncharacterized protein YjbI with pentapeptide repeats
VDQQEQSRRRPTKRQLLWAGVIATLASLIIVICGYLFGWRWTGLPERTLWDWLELLIVPSVLAIGGYLFTRSENKRTRQSAEDQRELDREIADQRTEEDRKIAQERAETDREIAEQRRQDEALQAYLDHIGELLLDNAQPLRQSEEHSEVRTLARSRTLTVLGSLDGRHKRSVLQFLYESRLIDQEQALLDKKSDLIERRHMIVSLAQADLSGASLGRANLRAACLRGAHLSWASLGRANLRAACLRGAKLFKANLYGADLIGANLGDADLREADLIEADLIGASLEGASLKGADLRRTHLSGANLRRTDLSGANLGGADLRGVNLFKANLGEAKLPGANLSGAFLSGAFLVLTLADLSGADLSGVEGITNEELEQKAASLEGATMPNGQKHEEWLKSKDQEENKKSAGSS